MRMSIGILGSCLLTVCIMSATPVPTVGATSSRATNNAVNPSRYHWGFQKSRSGIPPAFEREPFAPLLRSQPVLFLGTSDPPTLYLTFDNGYEAGYTPQLLDTLAKKKVSAVFFVTGQFVQSQPELLRRMVAEGHHIGNHSWSHPDMTQVDEHTQRRELDQLRQAVARITGRDHLLFMRPPRGIFSASSLRVASEAGYVPVFWSVAYKDWLLEDQRGADIAHLQVMSQLHPGAIVLLHAVSRDNCVALERIIDDARARGYRFGALIDLVIPGWGSP